MDTSSACGYSVDDEKGTVTTFLGKSITDNNAIERMFDNLVIASESSVTVALEKDYVDSLGLGSTLADSLKGLAGAKKSCTVTSGDNFKSQDVTGAYASLTKVPDSTETADAAAVLVLDFSSYSLFVKYCNAVKENAGKGGSEHGTVTIHLSAKSGDTSWTIGAIEGSLTHEIDKASWSSSDDDASAVAQAKKDLASYIGKKVYVEVSADTLSEETTIVDITTTVPAAGASDKYYVELDLTKANTSWATIVGNVATAKAVKGAKTGTEIGNIKTVPSAS